MGVDLHFNNQQTTVSPGPSLFDCAESLGIYVPTSCQKNGKCKECLVEVTAGMELLSPRTQHERHLKDTFRLSCRARITASTGTVRCHTMRRGELRVERHAFHLPLDRSRWKVDPCVTRDGDRILLDGKLIDRGNGPVYGLAMDLGTTTVVIRLINLETGDVLADSSFENPQRFGGSDVMSRIHYDSLHPNKILQRTLAGYVTHAIEQMPVDPNSIYEMVVVGNSTMRDLFFRLNVHSIGQNPYRSVTEIELKDGKRTSTALVGRPKSLLLPIHPKGRVYGLPIISGHVGADAAACMLAVDIASEDHTVAIMDIGTNTELVIGNKDRIVAASCPAGPAFEGGRILCGMPALEGAIERVTLREDGSVGCKIIGDGPPEGICGSGLIDLLGELLRTGRMNHLGRFEDEIHRFVVQSLPDGEIYVLEGDINELAQAKGANVAGLRIVFDRLGIRFDDVSRFYLAGGFGRHIDSGSAKRIGLIPDISDSKIVQVGNAAIEGACVALLSRSKRDELEHTIRKIDHCRLETDPNFFDYFVEGCQFGPLTS